MRLLAFTLIVVLLLLSGCEKPAEPVKIGFIGGLTGRVADLGISGRDAVLLAVEEINNRGGLHGQPVELLVRDDAQDSATVRKAVQEMSAARVVALIGPMTSQMAVEAVPLINKAKLVTISPTAKTDRLSGEDDYFFRVTPELRENSRALSRYLLEGRDISRMLVLYDTGNLAFTETWLQNFSRFFAEGGGVIVAGLPFAADSELSFSDLARRSAAADAQGVLVLANARNTAMFCQELARHGSSMPVFTSEWSFTHDVVVLGGSAVEGVSSFHSFNADSGHPDYLRFKKKFIKRFGYQPSFATTLAYDAAQVLWTALDRFQNPEDLREGLIRIGRYEGLQSTIHFNRFGDVQRELFLTTIENGKFVVGD